MSVKKNISEFSQEDKKKVDKELTIKLKSPIKNVPPKIIVTYNVDDSDDVILPFAYGISNFNLKKTRPKREFLPNIDVEFVAKLRPEQIVVKNEIVRDLNKTGSGCLSAYVGFGKCHGLNTPILMYDGSIKMVQDVKVGDQLMGDDSTPRNVLSLARGRETMYDVIPKKGEKYTVNESHILSLKCSKSNGKYKKGEIYDVSVEEYLDLPHWCNTGKDGNILVGYKVGVDFNNKDVELEPYMLGYWLGDGTNCRTEITTIEDPVVEYFKEYAEKLGCYVTQGKDTKNHKGSIQYTMAGKIMNGKRNPNKMMKMLQECNVIGNKHIPLAYKANSRQIRLELLAGIIDSDGYYIGNCYEITQKNEVLFDDIVYLARSLGFAAYKKKVKKSCMYNGEKKEGVYYRTNIHGFGLEEIPVKCERKKAKSRKQIKDALRTAIRLEKKEVDDYYGFTLDGNHRYLLGDFTVTHNTITAINIACTIKLRTLIIVNKIVLIKQWEESIKIFSPKATIQKVKPRAKLEDCDFYIINAQNVEKMGLEFFSNIGLCVVDEMHMIMAETLSRSLHYIFPRYLLGLSATPYRPDDLDILINYYFGNNKVIRELHREHHVYVIETGITYKVEKTIDGRLNWGNLLDQQSEHEERNQRIIDIVRKFNTRNFLILVKRVKQGKMLENSLKELGEDVTSLLGNSQEFNKESRILIGTCQKVGVGFDHKKLDALLLATDIEEYFIQYLGRVFRTRNQIPIVFDLVDNQQTLKRHYNTRKEVYLKHGGIITLNPC